MSIPFLDYLPCDLNLYSQKVLPAWQAAQYGNVQPVCELIKGADHLSYWPVFNIPDPLLDRCFAGPKSCWGWNYFDQKKSFWLQFLVPRYFSSPLYEALLQDAEDTDERSFWALCLRHFPEFFDDDDSQGFLFYCLFYTFCCNLPGEVMADCREIGNEGVYLWEEYMARSEDIEGLWEGFHALAPQPLADQLLAPQTYQEYLASFDDEDRKNRLKRALVEVGHNIMGFLDSEETVHLLDHLPTGEHPDLDIIVEGCIRDYEKEQWPLPPELEQLWHRIHFSWPEDEAGERPAPDSDGKEWWAYIERSRKIEQAYREEFLRISIKDKQQIMEIYRRMCAYWYEEFETFRKNINRYYESIERMETVILSRFRYAAERGWGMIELQG